MQRQGQQAPGGLPEGSPPRGAEKCYFVLYLEGQSVLGSLQGVIEPFTKGVGVSALVSASGPCCPWCLLL